MKILTVLLSITVIIGCLAYVLNADESRPKPLDLHYSFTLKKKVYEVQTWKDGRFQLKQNNRKITPEPEGYISLKDNELMLDLSAPGRPLVIWGGKDYPRLAQIDVWVGKDIIDAQYPAKGWDKTTHKGKTIYYSRCKSEEGRVYYSVTYLMTCGDKLFDVYGEVPNMTDRKSGFYEIVETLKWLK